MLRPSVLAVSGLLLVVQASSVGSSVGSAPIRFYQKYISDLRYGHCRFDPSCSQYGLEAIEQHGFFVGVVLTADRLVRCNPSAAHHHARGADGRLADPVEDQPAGRKRPEVPAWLLPELRDPPFPMGTVEVQLLTSGLPRGNRLSDLLDQTAFADALAAQGDCWRAETEYKRLAFLARTAEVDWWALMKTGNCYYRWESWSDASKPFLEAASRSPNSLEGHAARLMAAASYFNEGHYTRSREVIGASGITIESDDAGTGGPDHVAADGHDTGDRRVEENLLILSGLNSMALADWSAGAELFDVVARERADSPGRNQALFLKWKAEEGKSAVPTKHPNLAAGLSLVIPGSGQMYAARYYDGFRHLLVNGLLIYSVYQLFKDDYYAAGYLLAGFTLPFYVGNVVGAKRSAESYNASHRAEYLSSVIDEAGVQ